MTLLDVLYGNLPGEKADKETRELLRTLREMLGVIVHYHSWEECANPDNCGHCMAVKRAIKCFEVDSNR